MKRIPARLAVLAAAALVLSSSVVPSMESPALAATAAASGRLAGVVRDETGAVLAGATVRLTTPGGPAAGTGTTDADGRYAIPAAVGLYDVTVGHSDAAGPWTALVKNMSVWSNTPLDLSVVRPAPSSPPAPDPDATGPTEGTTGSAGDPAPDVTWQGRILGPGGDPIEPGRFTLEPAAGAPGGTLDVGGPDGSFTFTGPAGRYDLSLDSDLSPWGGGAGSGPGDGLSLAGSVDLTTDRSDDLALPGAAVADVVVAAVDGRKRTDPLVYSAARLAPVELAPGIIASATVHDTVGAADARFRPLLFGRSAVTFTVPHDPAPAAVSAPLEPGDRLAIVIGDRRAPPGAPQDVSVKPGDGRVKVTWSPPAGDGGTPLIDYLVTVSHGGSNSKGTFPVPATSGTIRNLINGTEYTVTVTARNAKGGTASAPVTVTLDPDVTTPVTVPGDGHPGDGHPGGDPLGVGSGDDGGPGIPGSITGRSGYWLLGADGAVYSFGDAAAHGDASAALAAASMPSAGSAGPQPVRAVDLESTPSGRGYWVLDTRGRVHPLGDAPHLGDFPPARLAPGELPASLSATPTGAGYWVFTSGGRALAFGDAAVLGDMTGTTLNGAVLDSVATPSGRGYFMVASDGGIFAFGDARFAGSMGGKALDAPVRSLVPDADGAGYWLVATDGGVFAFDAPFRGSMGGRRLNRPVRGMVPYGDGYLMVAEDGGVFAFSDRPFSGSLGDRPPASPVVSVAALG